MNHNIYRYLSIIETIDEIINYSENRQEKEDCPFVSRREALRIYNNAFIGLIKEGYPYVRQDDKSVCIDIFNKKYSVDFIYLKRHLGKELYILLPTKDNPNLISETPIENKEDFSEEKNKSDEKEIDFNDTLKHSEFSSSVLTDKETENEIVEDDLNTQNDNENSNNYSSETKDELVEALSNENVLSEEENTLPDDDKEFDFEKQKEENNTETEESIFKKNAEIPEETDLENETIELNDVVDLEDEVDSLDGIYYFEKDTEFKSDDVDFKKNEELNLSKNPGDNEENINNNMKTEEDFSIFNNQDFIDKDLKEEDISELFKKENLFYDKHVCSLNGETYEFYVFPNTTRNRGFITPIVAFCKYNGLYKMGITTMESPTKTIDFVFGNYTFTVRGKWKKDKFNSSIFVKNESGDSSEFKDEKEKFRPSNEYVNTFPYFEYGGHKFNLIPANTVNSENGTADVFVYDLNYPENIYSPAQTNILKISTNIYNFVLTAYWEDGVLKYTIDE